MGLRDFQERFQAKREAARWRSVVSGTYSGGHPLHPEEIKRAFLRLDPKTITVERNPILGSSTVLFNLQLEDVEGAKPRDTSYYEKDNTYVKRYLLTIKFYDQYQDLHSFQFITNNDKSVKDFLNKLTANFYALRENNMAGEKNVPQDTPKQPESETPPEKPKSEIPQPKSRIKRAPRDL